MALIPIPDDWDGETWCCYVIEWPSSKRWRAILNGQVTAPSRGRFWDEKTGTVVDAQSIGLEIFVRNILGGNMSCFEDLSASIVYLADRLYSKPCCEGSVNLEVYQGTSPEGEQIYGTQTPAGTLGNPEVDDPPEGYATWAAYHAYKCGVANLLVDGISGSMRNISYVSLAGSTIGVAAVVAAMAGFIVVPVAAIPVIIGALFAAEGVTAALLAVANWLEDNRDEAVCALYLADNTTDAVDSMVALVDDALAALVVASSLHPLVRTIALVIVSTDTLNQLFDSTVQAEYPGADCSTCGAVTCDDLVGSWVLTSEYTEGLTYPQGIYVLQAIADQLGVERADLEGCQFILSNVVRSDYTDPPAGWGVGNKYFCNGSNTGYTQGGSSILAALESAPAFTDARVISSSTTFTLSFDIESVTPCP